MEALIHLRQGYTDVLIRICPLLRRSGNKSEIFAFPRAKRISLVPQERISVPARGHELLAPLGASCTQKTVSLRSLATCRDSARPLPESKAKGSRKATPFWCRQEDMKSSHRIRSARGKMRQKIRNEILAGILQRFCVPPTSIKSKRESLCDSLLLLWS